MEDEAGDGLVLTTDAWVVQEVVLENAAESVALATSLSSAEKDRAGTVSVEGDWLGTLVFVAVVYIEAQKTILGVDGSFGTVSCIGL